jgi:hypothetical protein
VSRILLLALLVRNTEEASLAGSIDQALILERLGRAMPADWKEKRARISVNVVSPEATRALRASR